MRFGQVMCVLSAVLVLGGSLVRHATAQEALALSQYNQKDPYWTAELRLLRDHFALDADQLTAARDIITGASTEQQIQRRIYDRRRARWESAGQTDTTKPPASTENQRFSQRRLQIETAWLTEVRDLILRDPQRARWSSYERARRIALFMREQFNESLLLPAVLRDARLSPEQLAALAGPMEQHEQALDILARRYLALQAQWLSIRWGKASGDSGAIDRELEELGEEMTAKLFEVLRAGLRTVTGELSPESAQVVRELFETREAAAQFGLESFTDQSEFSEFLRISTLSSQQRTDVMQAMRRADAAVYKGYAAYRESMQKVRGDRAAQGKIAEQYRDDDFKIRSALYAQIRQTLTGEQRTAYDDGKEPPVDSSDVRARYSQDDESWSMGLDDDT